MPYEHILLKQLILRNSVKCKHNDMMQIYELHFLFHVHRCFIIIFTKDKDATHHIFRINLDFENVLQSDQNLSNLVITGS